MSSLIATIEQFDPGHFDRRYAYLSKLSKEVKEMGFFPLQITQNDLECYQIRVETKSGKWYSLYMEMVNDMKTFPDLLEALKEVALYEEKYND